MGTRFHSMKAALYCGAALAVIGAAAPALAQDVTGLPEVVITAERTTQNLQKVPISATVVSGEDLASRGVTRIGDLAQVAPSLAIQTYNRSVFVNIRGVGIAQSAPTSAPGVAFYLDGSFIPHESFIGGSFYDIESVEVLRGPQGTLTGQNSTGGAIYVRTPRPKFGEFSGYVDLTGGNYDYMKGVVAINVPLHETLAFRLAAIREKRDSYTTNIANRNSQPGDVNFTGYRAALRWQPISSLDALLRYENYDSDTDYIAVKNRNDRVTRDPFTIEEDAQAFSIVKGHRTDVEVSYDFTDALRVRWQSSFQDGVTMDLADGDRTATAPARTPNVGRLGYADSYIDSKIHEVDLIGDNGPFRWVLGAFYMQDDVDTHLYRYNNSLVTRDTAPTSTTLTLAENETKSGFGQVTWDITEQWQLIAGARYSHDTQTYNRILPASPAGVADSKETTGRVALNYQVTPDTLVYVSASRGYKAGGVNLVAGDKSYEPENNTVGEFGVKTTLFDGQLRVNGDIFTSKYENLQLGSLLPSRQPTTANIPESKSWGGELEVQGAFGNLRFNGGLSYLNAETDSSASILNNTITPSALGLAPSGSELPYSPEWTFNGGVEYDFAALGGRITPRVQVAYVADQYANIFRSNTSLIESHTVVDARVTYAPESERWQIEGFVNNIADETYVANQLFDSSSADGGILYGAPRTYGVRLLAKFGGPAEPAPPPPPPPPPAPPPPPPPPPVAYEAKEFIVYFPFDQYVLTPEAQSVISQAADYAKAGNATRVVVVGHADTSGSAAYNVKLSERRAKATADALVGTGIAQTALAVDWKGESQPAVATGDGVKEPLNRRATIDINF